MQYTILFNLKGSQNYSEENNYDVIYLREGKEAAYFILNPQEYDNNILLSKEILLRLDERVEGYSACMRIRSGINHYFQD